MNRRFISLRSGVAAALLCGFLAALGGAASAQESCQADFQKLTAKRMSGIEALNKLGKANKGKMDPVAACPVARRLVGIETEMFSYMEKNKDWCAIPDNVLDGFKEARAKTQNFASQACAVAAKVKKMQAAQKAQAAAGGAGIGGQQQKLPAGPL
jgi:hypothetical protein